MQKVFPQCLWMLSVLSTGVSKPSTAACHTPSKKTQRTLLPPNNDLQHLKTASLPICSGLQAATAPPTATLLVRTQPSQACGASCVQTLQLRRLFHWCPRWRLLLTACRSQRLRYHSRIPGRAGVWRLLCWRQGLWPGCLQCLRAASESLAPVHNVSARCIHGAQSPSLLDFGTCTPA